MCSTRCWKFRTIFSACTQLAQVEVRDTRYQFSSDVQVLWPAVSGVQQGDWSWDWSVAEAQISSDIDILKLHKLDEVTKCELKANGWQDMLLLGSHWRGKQHQSTGHCATIKQHCGIQHLHWGRCYLHEGMPVLPEVFFPERWWRKVKQEELKAGENTSRTFLAHHWSLETFYYYYYLLWTISEGEKSVGRNRNALLYEMFQFKNGRKQTKFIWKTL